MKNDLAKSKYSASRKKKSVLNKTIGFFIKSPYHAYLVGGYVRDKTLGRTPVDIDIVVEGDAIEAAKKLNQKLKEKLHTFKEFGTASITTKIARIDLASARVEKYPRPAVLPHVYPSTIIEDLNRRDFTINAIAMSISKENCGEIIDPFSGLKDIKKKLIRVLHKNSFIDDPTRIFRALRYKNRFGFKIEQRTEKLMREAIAKKMIQKLTGQRILNELKLIFGELTYQQTIEDISKFRIYKIKPRDSEILPLIGAQRLYFYLSRLNSKKFPLTKEERKLIHNFDKIEDIITRLTKASKNSTIYNILSPIDSNVISVIPRIRPELDKKIKIYARFSKVKPFLKGNDLKRLGIRPSRQYKTLLNKIFALQLDKKIKSRKDAVKFVKNR